MSTPEAVRRVSFEGERGTGKSTVAKCVIELLQSEDKKPLLNRGIETGKLENPIYLKTVDIHARWEALVNSGENPDLAEKLAYQKFHHGLTWLMMENDIFEKETGNIDYLVCDRDIDTAVLYAGIEIILSNPEKYRQNSGREELFRSLWTMALSVRKLPDITFCLTTKDPDKTLERSYLAKKDTKGEFALTPIQEQSQKLASDMLGMVIGIREELYPENKVITINTDGKRPEEVARVVENYLLKDCVLLPEDDLVYPVVSLKTIDPEKLKPTSVEELSILIFSSCSGAAFPTRQEVELGFSNCVYSNISLCYWSRRLGLGEFQLVTVLNDSATGTNPIHWAAFEIIDNVNSVGRVIDLTPFLKAPYIGEPVFFETKGDGEIIVTQPVNPIGIKEKYDRLSIDDPNKAAALMDLACLSEKVGLQPEDIDQALTTYKQEQQESYRIFAGIRLIRMYEKMKSFDSATALINELVDDFPTNLLLAREIARMITEQTYQDIQDRRQYLLDARSNILKSSQNMGQEEAAKFTKYYEWVLNLNI